jgi:hypothetical protein
LHVSDPKQKAILREQPRPDAFKVACMLLAEHESQGDSTFKGITPLHLASYMGDLCMVRKLIAMPGTDICKEGQWPGLPKPVKPCDLINFTTNTTGPFDSMLPQADTPVLQSPIFKTLLEQISTSNVQSFQDLDDFQLERQDMYGTPFALRFSPRRIFDEAYQIWNLLQPAPKKLM